MNNAKMIRAANTLDTLAKVAAGIFRVCGFVCLVFAVLVLIFGSKMFVPGSLTLDLDFVKLYLADSFQAVTGMIKLYAFFGVLAAGIFCFAAYYACTILRKIFTPMKDGRPFDPDTPANLRKMAWIVLIGGGLTQIVGIIERMILTKAYPMDEIFSSSAIAKIEYVQTMDLSFVLVACVILLLSYIFSYGQTLQKESDETL